MEGVIGLGDTSIAAIGTSESGASKGAQQFLTFMLDEQEYGVDILDVQEIRGKGTVTRIPNVPSDIRGIINLRGIIVPVVDLRVRFGMEAKSAPPKRVSIVVLKVKSGNRERAVGIVVDAVSDVYSVTADNIKDAPEMGDDVDHEFASGLAIVGERLIILLEASKLLSGEATGDLEAR